jgi:phosphopantetheinyl transferase (holo-ACP synthase)
MQGIDNFHFELISTDSPAERSSEWGKQSSRQALAACLKKMGKDFKSPEDLTIVGHTYLENHPKITVSLSHSRKVGAAMLADRDLYPSVGIDIEFLDRKVTNGAEKFFINEEDGVEAFEDTLRTWTLKEAAFKALSPFIKEFNWPKVLVLKDIWIKDGLFGLLGNSEILGKVFSENRELNGQEILVSFAFLNPLQIAE